MSRTYKKAYTRSKRFDKSCRNNGGCPYSKSNREYQHKKQPSLKEALELMDQETTWLDW